MGREPSLTENTRLIEMLQKAVRGVEDWEHQRKIGRPPDGAHG